MLHSNLHIAPQALNPKAAPSCECCIPKLHQQPELSKALSAAALGTTALAGYQVGLVVYFSSIFDRGLYRF